MNLSFFGITSLTKTEDQALIDLERAMNGLPESAAIYIGPATGQNQTKKNRTWLIAGAVVLGFLVFGL